MTCQDACGVGEQPQMGADERGSRIQVFSFKVGHFHDGGIRLSACGGPAGPPYRGFERFGA